MTVAPWGFGIDRASFEAEVVSLCELLMRSINPDWPDDRVHIIDQAGACPEPPRPNIGVRIGVPVNLVRAGENARYWGAPEEWLITFTDSADGAYTVNANGTDYTVNAVGLTIEQLRDAMQAEFALGADPEFITAPVGTDQIEVTSLVNGLMLMLSTTPETIQLERTRLNYIKRGFLPATMQVNLEVHGLLSIEDPLATQSAPSLAEVLRSGFLDQDLSQGLRRCWFAPINARLFEGAEMLNSQTVSEATCQVIFRATSRLDVQVQSGTEIPIEVVIPGVNSP